MRNEKTQKIVLASLFYSIGLVLPFITGQIPEIGKMLLPMHIPVLICSLVVGWKYGLAIGLLLPITRSLLFHFPTLYPNAVGMTFELAAYGFFAGFIYERLLQTRLNRFAALIVSLLAAMIVGRIVWGAASLVLYGLRGEAFTLGLFIGGAFINAMPGIIAQLVLIPAIVAALEKADIKI
ncbi:MAG: ECF transporter S component [Clostridia bacterium]|nr:ECF transporter S component [Clostridia bacterium]